MQWMLFPLVALAVCCALYNMSWVPILAAFFASLALQVQWSNLGNIIFLPLFFLVPGAVLSKMRHEYEIQIDNYRNCRWILWGAYG